MSFGRLVWTIAFGCAVLVATGVALRALDLRVVPAVSAQTLSSRPKDPSLPTEKSTLRSTDMTEVAPTPVPSPLPMGAITMSGEGSASSAPDVAYVTLGVATMGSSVSDATTGNSGTMAAVVSAIGGQNVADSDIQTGGFSITPQYGQAQSGGAGPPPITGYLVTSTVSVTISQLSKASSVIAAAVQAGANTAIGIRFSAKDSTALQQQALTAALQQAKAKADTAANATGLKLTGTYSVVEQAVSTPVPGSQVASSSGATASTLVAPDQYTVRVLVNVAYLYER